MINSLVAVIRLLGWINHRVEAQLRAWRWGRPVQTFGVIAALFVHAVTIGDASASEAAVRFDVPSLAEAVVVGNDPKDSDLMAVRLSVPVTSEITSADRQNIDEFRFDISWQQSRYPVTDYGPRTQTTSSIQGTIDIETHKDRSATFGLALKGAEIPVIGGTARADAAVRDAKEVRYQEIPRHDVLVASGTVDRGTGVFFRFHRSRRETLEGSRDLSVTFRVPRDWKAGLLHVKCQANGQRKVAGLWKEPIQISRTFLLPIYLASSGNARDRAVEYVRAEHGLRTVSVAGKEPSNAVPQPKTIEQTLRGVFSLANNRASIESQSRVVRYRVPMSVSNAKGRYKNAREELLQLSR
jgi:hypothetical protein